MTETLDDMITFDLQDRGIRDARVLSAFRTVDRRAFVPELDRAHAYDDRALRISHGQTLSQPFMVAHMTQLLGLKGGERVLEIGTGSGYQTAILSVLAREIYTVERIEYLATTAEDRLLDLGYANIQYHLGDGTAGWAEHAPYDRIIVTAAAPRVPQALLDQLADGGVLVAPIGQPEEQILTVIWKRNGKLETASDTPCAFVPLIGKDGYSERDAAAAFERKPGGR